MMRNSRFRQIARLQKLAGPFLKRKHEADREWEVTIIWSSQPRRCLGLSRPLRQTSD